MAESVIDPFEVVDVDEAECQRATVVQGVLELVGEALVKVAVVSEAGQRIRQGKSRGAHGAQQRSLVELDREQRPRERQREPGRLLPDNDQRQHA